MPGEIYQGAAYTRKYCLKSDSVLLNHPKTVVTVKEWLIITV